MELTPDQYLELRPEAWPTDEFLSRLPLRTTAICPYCMAHQMDPVDIYSLRSWANSFDGYSGQTVFSYKGTTRRCPHFDYVLTFIHLNNVWPEFSDRELNRRLVLPAEVPHIFPEHMAAGRTFIGAIPIHRIEGGDFVPRYTLYVVTRFKRFLFGKSRRWQTMALTGISDEGEFGATCRNIPEDIASKDEFWDLDYWVAREKLYWADLSSEKPTILTGARHPFPFSSVEGRRDPYWIYYANYGQSLDLPDPLKQEFLPPSRQGSLRDYLRRTSEEEQ
ncbi:MAG: hypothetical protein JNM27_09740 [Leptospirales bacterium]|nr:hypothetical protein [Leptospirales bacterium]